MSELTKNISNSDITWGADFVGLAPTVTGDDATLILEDIENPISDLLLALSDPNKFVAAHVLLTKITGVRYGTFPSWNGLDVNIHATGDVEIDAEQRHRLAKRWRLYFQTEPRPASLP